VPNTSPGRPKKATERDKRHLFFAARRYPEYPIVKLAEQAGIDSCHKTVAKVLAEMELVSIVAASHSR
jgi:hypothetical protein